MQQHEWLVLMRDEVCWAGLEAAVGGAEGDKRLSRLGLDRGMRAWDVLPSAVAVENTNESALCSAEPHVQQQQRCTVIETITTALHRYRNNNNSVAPLSKRQQERCTVIIALHRYRNNTKSVAFAVESRKNRALLAACLRVVRWLTTSAPSACPVFRMLTVKMVGEGRRRPCSPLSSSLTSKATRTLRVRVCLFSLLSCSAEFGSETRNPNPNPKPSTLPKP